ncbi:Glucose/arabinose dehydrogenase, beta-propeller fold [Hymenobacter daecheongensis DSM 21074]|uniref:Glucose/arabinose dehydrogenase, beta-propeller fold n=1 Tax=Hymenobacter daecheongensis DSM 21074 TaxID=1121955 RepID=A0A1M6FCG5_9BACT|nr:PQQ-dependent sugar dehydrogenase [Hymenobacter daecheongensis]SHI95351.1 Glucose/arabinose dehydrogenase, beta-propeller fold [Hymenobacter daecheongensis DSM 21074]
MKTTFPLALTAAVLLGTLQARAQNDYEKTVKDGFQVNVFKPGKAEATDANVAQLKAPAGFTVSKFAEKAGNPRMLAVAPNGDVYASDRTAGTIMLLRDTNKDGKADLNKEVARRPDLHGLALREGKLYISAIRELYVADIKADGTLGELKTLYKDLPDAGQHPNRTINFGPDGKLYLSVGSTCNACDERNKESATLLQINTDGSGRRVFAKGLRNTIGFGWHPSTKALWGFDHGIDWLGDEDQREELNEIKEGADYGWPYVYADGKIPPHPQPADMTPEQYAAKTTKPVQLYAAHAAPLGMVFNTGTQFPKEYQHDAFVTMHGSWNRAEPSGYRIVRVRFDAQGRATGIEDFVTGWLVNNNKEQFGRVCGIAQHPDGSLLVSDDAGGVIYRVAYAGGSKGKPAEKVKVKAKKG